MKEDIRIKSKTRRAKTGDIKTEPSVLFNRNTFILLRFELMFETMCKTVFKTVFKPMFKTVFKIVFKTVFKTVFKKLKKIANKNMSFLKITVPRKRDFIVNEFLKIRQNIQ